jgi:cytochrome c-type biogenesis protein CcmH/NrfG
MNDPQRILQPLDEATPAVERLGAYEGGEQLAESVDAVWRAVDRSLRLLLRADPEVPDEHRLHALSPNVLAAETVIASLRERNRITLELAGMTHDLARAGERARAGRPRAADADLAQATAARLRQEIIGQPAGALEPPAPVAAPAGMVPLHEDAAADRRRSRRLFLFAAAVFFLAGMVMLYSILSTPAPMETGAAAFEAGHLDFAEREFLAALDQEPDNVSAMLYLGRIYRRTDRPDQAADVLRNAARLAPEDDAVLRELGHLFMDLDRAGAAADQFRRAVELQPAEHANWIGLISAMRHAGDPAAEEWLRRAPPEVQARMSSAPPLAPYRPDPR